MIALAICSLSTTALADDLSGGTLQAGGHRLPLLSSDAAITVTGDIATVRVVQTFANDRPEALNARYLFPLPHDAAVHAMTLEVDGEAVRAQIQKIGEAKKTFEAAKAQGKTATLLEQHRANVFSQDVANIPAGERVRVTIEYAQTIPYEDGKYRLHFPMVVASRYDNGANGVAVPELNKPLPKGLLHREDPRQAVSKASTERRVTVRARLITGVPIAAVNSPSHRLESTVRGAGDREVMLAAGRVVDDRDFVLEYGLSGSRIGAGLVRHSDARGRFFTLLVQPPEVPPAAEIKARELVFVLDASCSMGGRPLEASKALIKQMLASMRPADTFRLIVFGSTAHHLARVPLSPTQANLQKIGRHLDRLGTMGGTEIELGIKAALADQKEGGAMRLVVFLTDGYIGSEASVMATIRRHRGAARIFAFGIGDSVNRWLIEEMAVAGKGVARIVGSGDASEAVVNAFATRMQSPMITDAWVDWGDADVTDVTPAATFDLYAGAPVRLMGRLPSADFDTAPMLVGSVAGERVRVPIKLGSATVDGGAEAVPVLWARSQVADRIRAMTAPGADGVERQQLVDEITKLGLDFAITTRWTAFVAVSEREAAPAVASTQVALAAPHGVQTSFGGRSTPEPEQWAAMLLLLAAAAWHLRRRVV